MGKIRCPKFPSEGNRAIGGMNRGVGGVYSRFYLWGVLSPHWDPVPHKK